MHWGSVLYGGDIVIWRGGHTRHIIPGKVESWSLCGFRSQRTTQRETREAAAAPFRIERRALHHPWTRMPWIISPLIIPRFTRRSGLERRKTSARRLSARTHTQLLREKLAHWNTEYIISSARGFVPIGSPPDNASNRIILPRFNSPASHVVKVDGIASAHFPSPNAPVIFSFFFLLAYFARNFTTSLTNCSTHLRW